MAEIHWFPGHMKKALNNVEDSIKLVDVVIELLDARAPKSSINNDLEKLIQNKKRILVLSKDDLADQEETKKWTSYFKNTHESVISLDLSKPNAGNILSKEVAKVGKSIWEKQAKKGMKPQPIKTMIIGIPNVGKSSLINRFAKKSAAGVQNKPGFTRGQQWIKVSNEFALLDTPGILPMAYEDKNKAMHLALVGSIREDILPQEQMCDYLLNFLRKHYPNCLSERFGINEITSCQETLLKICEKRSLMLSGQPDTKRAMGILLNEFKNGLFGRVTLERI